MAAPDFVGDSRRRWAGGRLLDAVRDARGSARWLLWIGVGLTSFFVLMALLAPLISPYDFDQFRADGVPFPRYEHPSAAHPFGTTAEGTDVLARVIYGARTALEVVLMAVLGSLLVGVPLGLLAGYFGGAIDRVLVVVMDALFAFPYLLMAIVIAFVLADSIGRGVVAAAIAIAVVYVPQYFRVVRNQVLSVREEAYVDAARAMGARNRTIVGRYVFFNVVHAVPVVASLNAADALLTLAGLGYLGYGVQPTQAAEWGYEIQRATSDFTAGIWWTGLFPGLAIVLFVTGLTLIGEGLNDTTNPILRRRRRIAVTDWHFADEANRGEERDGKAGREPQDSPVSEVKS